MNAVLRVLTLECPTLSDGRPRHYYRKVDGVFVCSNCGEPKS